MKHQPPFCTTLRWREARHQGAAEVCEGAAVVCEGAAENFQAKLSWTTTSRRFIALDRSSSLGC